jgi:hypothetical protein
MNGYERLAAAGGFTVCFAPHTNGHTGPSIHVIRDRFTQRGAFMLLCEAYDKIGTWHREAWLWRWQRVRWIIATTAGARMRLKRSVWDYDRARMREELSEYAERIPTYARHEEYAKACRWAARS